MKKEHVIQLLNAAGVKNVRDSGGEWVNFSCPLARWTHSKGTDHHPSAGVSCNDEGISVWLCYSCNHESKPLETLLHSIWVSTGLYPYDAAAIFAREEILIEKEEKERELNVPDIWSGWSEVLPEDELPSAILQFFPLLTSVNTPKSSRAMEFLCKKRGINPGVLDVFGVRFCEEYDSIVFPLTTHDGTIKVLRMREPTEKIMKTVSASMFNIKDMEFPKIKNTGVWFGLHLIDWMKPIMLVEGEIDCMRLHSLGFKNVIASCTSSITESQIGMLCGFNYILGFDTDDAGKKGNEKVIKFLRSFVSISLAKWPDKDPGNLKSALELNKVLNTLKLIKSA